MTGTVVLLAALAATAVLAVWHRRRDGALRFSTRAGSQRPHRAGSRRSSSASTSGGSTPDLRPLVPGAVGDRATLLQFSSAFCAPCRATRRTLAEIAQLVPGVTHVEVDAESHLDLVRRLGVLKTPTTLVLDAGGREVVRASGQPRKADVLAALGQAVPS